MLMMVLHDANGREVYVNPYAVTAVYPAGDFSAGMSGSIIVLHGNQVQVKEVPGAIFYLLKQVPMQSHDFS